MCCAWAMLAGYFAPCFVVAGPSFLMRQAFRGGSVLAGGMWRSAAPAAMGVKQLPSLVGSSPSVRHMHHLNRHYGDIPYQIIFVMLANLTDDVTALRTAAERWSFVFKDNNLRSGNKKAITQEKVLKHVDTLVQDEPQLERFIERLAVSNIPVDEQEKYERDLSWYFRDLEERFQEKMEEGRKEGREEGREEGEQIGLEKARLQMAESMKENGFSEEEIQDVLGRVK